MAPISPVPTPRNMSPPPEKSKRYLSQFRSSEVKMTLPGHPLTKAGVPRRIKKPKQILYLLGIFALLYWFGIRHGLGEKQDGTPLGYYAKGRHRHSSLAMHSKYGMALLKQDGKEHPIYELMERGEERWNRLLNGQSQTLREAAGKYERRYGMPPPLGFDKWWDFCETHNITIRDDYDHIMKDVLLHHALEPAEWRKRALALDGEEWSYTFKVSKKEGINVTGDGTGKMRANFMTDLVGGFLEELPDDFATQITISDHDAGSQVVGADQRKRGMELVRKESFFTKAELKHLQSFERNDFFGWNSACDAKSVANTRPEAENTTYSGDAKSFILDHLPTMDFCKFPELKKLHGCMATDYDGRSASIIRPIGVLSKFPGDASFQVTPVEGFWNITEKDLNHEGYWEEKTDSRLFWRGTSTGGFDAKYRDWRDSHRIRMHTMLNGRIGDQAWGKEEKEIMMPDGKGGWRGEKRRADMLSMAYADVKLSGRAHQCDPALCAEIEKEVAFAPRMEPSESLKYKYALDLDGNGWSSRFHRLLSGASPVIKMTMFPEWHQGWLIPWYHYIPLKPDYSDLYDIMAFFVGPMDVYGKIDESLGHDHLARKIGEAGQQFALHQWNWRNMQAYTFRLLLEIQRLYASDRRAASLWLPR